MDLYVKMTDKEYEEYKKYLENKNLSLDEIKKRISNMNVFEILELKGFVLVDQGARNSIEYLSHIKTAKYYKDKTTILVEQLSWAKQQ